MNKIYEIVKDYSKLKTNELSSFHYPELTKRIGLAIKFWRLKKGYEQREVARMTGIPASTVSAIETGRSSMRIADLYLMARYCNMELAISINGEDIKLFDFSHWVECTGRDGRYMSIRTQLVDEKNARGLEYDSLVSALMDYQDSMEGGMAVPSVKDYCDKVWGKRD